MNATLVGSSVVLGMEDQIVMSDVEVQIQGDVMNQILLVEIEIIIKKGFAILIVIKTEVMESGIETDTGLVIGIALKGTAGTGIVMIVIGKIGIKIIMVTEIIEDPGIETTIRIVSVTEVMIEIVTGTTTTKTGQDTVESGVGRGVTMMTITAMKLYTCSFIFVA